MRKQVQGIAFILFGLLLVLVAAFDPVLSDITLRLISDLLALIMGMIGLVLCFRNDDKSDE